MRNPFSEFASFERQTESKIPLDDILSAHQDVLGRLTEGFKRLVADEAGEGLWQPDGDSIVRVYGEASEIVSAFPYTVGDIEAFTVAAISSGAPPSIATITSAAPMPKSARPARTSGMA